MTKLCCRVVWARYARCAFSVNVMVKDTVIFGTNWTAEGEYGGFCQAVAQGIYDAGTPCSGTSVCRVVQPSADHLSLDKARAGPPLVHRTRIVAICSILGGLHHHDVRT